MRQRPLCALGQKNARFPAIRLASGDDINWPPALPEVVWPPLLPDDKLFAQDSATLPFSSHRGFCTPQIKT
jgi:hypothetical protein